MNPERLEAACRLLIDSGDLTPMGARMLQRINEADLAIAEPIVHDPPQE